MKEYALIVAGGAGNRMKANLPKQFIKIGDMPILMHTIRQFYCYSPQIEIILALPENSIELWQELMYEYDFTIPHAVVHGGITRGDSVKNGLSMIDMDNSLVAIHDGVRPLVAISIIERSFILAKEKGSAITVIPLKDSIRELKGDVSMACERTRFCLVQTPQTFHTKLIKQAYQNIDYTTLTDDASVAESAGIPIYLSEGNYTNIKITSSEDLLIAETLIKKNV